MEARQQIVELAYKHLEECHRMERKGFKGQNSFEDDKDIPKPTITELPDIDDERFQDLIKNDKLIVLILSNFQSTKINSRMPS